MLKAPVGVSFTWAFLLRQVWVIDIGVPSCLAFGLPFFALDVPENVISAGAFFVVCRSCFLALLFIIFGWHGGDGDTGISWVSIFNQTADVWILK